MDIVDLDDIVMEASVGESDDLAMRVVERRVAKDVIAVPILRQDVEMAIEAGMTVVREGKFEGGQTSCITGRDGGIFDYVRQILSQGVMLGDTTRNEQQMQLKRVLPPPPPIAQYSSNQIAITSYVSSWMKVFKEVMDDDDLSELPYVALVVALRQVFGLHVKGLLLEVADRPDAQSLTVGGAILVGSANDRDGLLTAANAYESIRRTQSGSSVGGGGRQFLKCYADELVGVYFALQYLAASGSGSASTGRSSSSAPATPVIVVSKAIADSLGIDAVIRKEQERIGILGPFFPTKIAREKWFRSMAKNENKESESDGNARKKASRTDGGGDKGPQERRGSSSSPPTSSTSSSSSTSSNSARSADPSSDEAWRRRLLKREMDATVFLKMSIEEKRAWLRAQGIGTAMPRPREGLRALNAACFSFLDLPVIYETLRRLAECDGDADEAAAMENFESKKPRVAKEILLAQSRGNAERAQELTRRLQQLGRLRYDPFKPYLPPMDFDVEEWYFKQGQSG